MEDNSATMKKIKLQIYKILNKFRSFCRLILLLIGFFIFSKNALAENLTKLIPESNDYYLLYDPDLDEIIVGKNYDIRIAPSSMTKLMTAYVVFYQLAQGKIDLNNYCLVGKDAWNKYGSTMFLNYGDVVSISDLLKGLLVMSGNDAAIALAQVSTKGGYDSFIKMMNKAAQKLGMKNSNFKNPHGLNEDGHYSSLYDLAILIENIYNQFPQYSHFLELQDFEYNGIKQKNRNPLIKNNYDGILGGKTGYTNDGGYGVAAIVKRNYRRLIAVVNKAKTPAERSEQVTKLLDYGFAKYKKIIFFKAGDIVANLETWLGKSDFVAAIVKEDIIMNLPYEIQSDEINVELDYFNPIYTPIIAGDKIGRLTISFADKKFQFPVYAKDDVMKVEFRDKVKLILKHIAVKYSDLNLLNMKNFFNFN